MFERFTDRARRVMALANQEANRRGHEYIGTEHILLGLIEEGSGVAANLLKSIVPQLTLARAHAEVDKLLQNGNLPNNNRKLPQTPRAKLVLKLAIDEASALKHNYVGTEHLLLGLIREYDGIAAQVLQTAGVDLSRVRQDLLDLLQGAVESSPTVPLDESTRAGRPIRVTIGDLVGNASNPPLSECFTRILRLAEMESKRLGHEYVGTEHLLLGLARERQGLGFKLLDSAQISPELLEAQIAKVVPAGMPRDVPDSPRRTPRADLVLKYAVQEARMMSDPCVQSEHLLLALLEEPAGIAWVILNTLGLSLQDARSRLAQYRRTKG